MPRGQHDGEEVYAFIHLTFQEYFAAFAVRSEFWTFERLFQSFDGLAQCCIEWAKDVRAHEPLIVLFEMFAELGGLGDKLAYCLHEQVEGSTALSFLAELLGDTEAGISAACRTRLLETLLSHATQGDVSLARKLWDQGDALQAPIRTWLLDRLPPQSLAPPTPRFARAAATLLGDEGVKALAHAPSLQSLDLSFTQVTDEGVKALRRAKPGLKIVH